jgi:hypothetical protein
LKWEERRGGRNDCELQVYTKIRNTVSSIFVNLFCAVKVSRYDLLRVFSSVC